MLFLAAATTMNRIESIPTGVWLRIAAAVAALVVLVVVLRKVAHMNKVVLAIVTLLILSIIGFNWIYERNEPAWATPVIEKLSGFFPNKNSMK